MSSHAGSTDYHLELEILLQDAEPAVLCLSKPYVLIGSDAICDVVLPKSSGVAGRHCRIVALKNAPYQISDCGSPTGTYVDGSPVIEQVEAAAEAIIAVGSATLRIISISLPRRRRRPLLHLRVAIPAIAAAAGVAACVHHFPTWQARSPWLSSRAEEAHAVLKAMKCRNPIKSLMIQVFPYDAETEARASFESEPPMPLPALSSTVEEQDAALPPQSREAAQSEDPPPSRASVRAAARAAARLARQEAEQERREKYLLEIARLKPLWEQIGWQSSASSVASMLGPPTRAEETTHWSKWYYDYDNDVAAQPGRIEFNSQGQVRHIIKPVWRH